jgi:hypothetical protein
MPIKITQACYHRLGLRVSLELSRSQSLSFAASEAFARKIWTIWGSLTNHQRNVINLRFVLAHARSLQEGLSAYFCRRQGVKARGWQFQSGILWASLALAARGFKRPAIWHDAAKSCCKTAVKYVCRDAGRSSPAALKRRILDARLA